MCFSLYLCTWSKTQWPCAVPLFASGRVLFLCLPVAVCCSCVCQWLCAIPVFANGRVLFLCLPVAVCCSCVCQWLCAVPVFVSGCVLFMCLPVAVCCSCVCQWLCAVPVFANGRVLFLCLPMAMCHSCVCRLKRFHSSVCYTKVLIFKDVRLSSSQTHCTSSHCTRTVLSLIARSIRWVFAELQISAISNEHSRIHFYRYSVHMVAPI